MDVNFTPLLPTAQLLVTALVVMLRDLFIEEHEPKRILVFLSLVGIGLAAGETLALWGVQESAFHDSIVLDNFAHYFALIFMLAAGLTILSSIDYVRQAGIHEGEFYALVLFATVGMMLMAAANDLMVFFLGLETMSIAVYVLTGMWRTNSRSSEAAMKYFLMGAFATGFLLYGIALIYGATGSTNLDLISDYLAEQPSEWPLYLIGGGFLLLIGFAFKVGAVPFHFWVPDVYEGAPTPVTGFMSVAVKAAAFAAWARILLHKLSALDSDWLFPLWVITIGTMTLGNLLAITQSSVKRMLAYSSIAHAGYLLIAIVVGAEWGGLPLLFYVLTYSFMTIGAFAVLSCLSEANNQRENYRDFAGLGFKRPFLGLAMSLFMLSLAGFPPLGGFAGKFYVFRAAVLSGHIGLAIIGVLNSLLSVIYYLRVIVAMYMEEGGAEGKSFRQATAVYVAIAVAVIGTLYLGILPASALNWSRIAFASLE
ncbi:MAG: NADH-quinone oxidoreductase subunit N [Deltaproteobacteria bacterium]|nr:MAG: NADH-quinone oxidoreductase subunit N [Deltaproteobacteria bacterium]